MHELDRHCPFPDGRGTPFGRPGADIAGREHAGDIRLEQVIRVGCRTRENEAVSVAGDGVVEPLGARERPEKQEQERERKAVAVGEGDGGQAAVLAVESRDLAPIPDSDTVPLELLG